MKTGTYYGLLTPEDNGVPDMFFRTEAWARAAIQAFDEEHPEMAGQARLVRVLVRYEVLS